MHSNEASTLEQQMLLESPLSLRKRVSSSAIGPPAKILRLTPANNGEHLMPEQQPAGWMDHLPHLISNLSELESSKENTRGNSPLEPKPDDYSEGDDWREDIWIEMMQRLKIMRDNNTKIQAGIGWRETRAPRMRRKWCCQCQRDVAKAVVQLMKQPKWDSHTYVFGETATWPEVLQKVEKLLNIKIQRTFAPLEEIKRLIEDTSDSERQYIASVDE
ncbi:hypothetical protein FDECE_11423 [Fusarium decemcellulare]|nr:hypothetical protein FDECE_11423 [Fusarium decemcellulare]